MNKPHSTCGTFSFQDPLQPPIATLATQMPPDAPPNALKITVRVLALGSFPYFGELMPFSRVMRLGHLDG